MLCRVTTLLLIGALMGGGCSADSHDDDADAAINSLTAGTNDAFQLEAIARQYGEGALGRGGGPRSAVLEEARSRVATARCARMETCGEIGDGRRYATVDACIDGEAARVTSWWGNACEAPSSAAVDACIADVAGDFCPTSFDRVFIPAVGACAAPSVCNSTRASP